MPCQPPSSPARKVLYGASNGKKDGIRRANLDGQGFSAACRRRGGVAAAEDRADRGWGRVGLGWFRVRPVAASAAAAAGAAGGAVGVPYGGKWELDKVLHVGRVLCLLAGRSLLYQIPPSNHRDPFVLLRMSLFLPLSPAAPPETAVGKGNGRYHHDGVYRLGDSVQCGNGARPPSRGLPTGAFAELHGEKVTHCLFRLARRRRITMPAGASAWIGRAVFFFLEEILQPQLLPRSRARWRSHHWHRVGRKRPLGAIGRRRSSWSSGEMAADLERGTEERCSPLVEARRTTERTDRPCRGEIDSRRRRRRRGHTGCFEECRRRRLELDEHRLCDHESLPSPPWPMGS